VNEHEHEPVGGLPELLPEGEHILWQGAPEWWPLANRAFHVRLVLVYFGLLMGWSLSADLYAGVNLGDAMLTACQVLPLAFLVAGFLAVYAWLSKRSTVYTVTTRRVVMRYGVALPVSLNLPFNVVQNATLRLYRDGTGDIPLRLNEEERVSYLMLWPHVRPWRTAKPQPMIRSIPNAQAVAQTLGRALAEAAKQRGVPAAQLELACVGSEARPRSQTAAA